MAISMYSVWNVWKERNSRWDRLRCSTCTNRRLSQGLLSTILQIASSPCFSSAFFMVEGTLALTLCFKARRDLLLTRMAEILPST